MSDVTQLQLDGLGARFDKGFDEIKALLRSFDERIRSIELREAACGPLLTARLSAAERQIAAQKMEIDELRDLINKQAIAAQKFSVSIETIGRWGKWVAGIAGAIFTSGLLYLLGRLIYLAVAP